MIVLVTGASGGLGFHIVSEAVARGHAVIAAVRSLGHVPESCRLFYEQHADRISTIEMDVTDEEQVRRAADFVRSRGGVVDCVVNNAAIMIGREDTIETLDLELMRQSFEVNVYGAMRVVQHFLPMLPTGGGSCVINISSEAGTIVNAFPTNYPYSMSKTALNMFSERLRAHLGDRGIRVFAVHPGWMRTNMGGSDAPADPAWIAAGILDIIENKKKIYSKIAFIDSTGRPMPL